MSDLAWEAVIFDCDGVLVDSERLSNQVMAEMVTALGIPLTLEETIERFVGRSMPACIEMIEREIGRPVPEGFAAEYDRRLFDLFERKLEAVPGVADALDALDARRVPVCVASSGSHAKLRTSLTRTGLYPRFAGRIFSASEVARGKPHPDLFLHAAARLGARPRRCAVVEDSLLGVEAGAAAGMTVFGYPGTVTADRLRAAGAVVVPEMRALPALLREHRPPADGC